MSILSAAPRRHRTRLVLLLVVCASALCLALAAAGTNAWGGQSASPVRAGSGAPPSAGPAPGEPYVETRLFFGTGRHGGEPPVTEQQFHAFLDSEITPRFPAGLTLQEGYGQWRDRAGDINSERSYELVLLYPATKAKESDKLIEEIRARYTERWGMESVGRVDDEVRVSW
ncbi:DUF3574 domain-containing protein [Streptomyces sp. TRM70308]|uniref:DUF3574 domain-containing protein n=1 Tax=Streptomyces sp. TRM70308 TaxID=3131932 RepID=UPI003D0293DB